jgi:hypoxanthine phosphoribosyltransferase
VGAQPAKPAVLISREQVKEAVKRLAAEIRLDYAGKKPLVVGILKGSFMFLADLIRELDMPIEIEFIGLSSYGSGMESSGQVRLTRDIKTDVKGRDVLVVEDIVDTGHSLGFLVNHLKDRQPGSFKLCALLDKPSRRVIPVKIDYLGFTVSDKFIVGYGIDFDEQYRYLPDICTLPPGYRSSPDIPA